MRRLYNRPRLQSGWLEQRAPHAAPGSANADLVAALRASVSFQPDNNFPRHKYADVSMRDFLAHFLVSFETPDDRDATPMIAVLMTLATECVSDPNVTCRVFVMDADDTSPRERSLGQDDSEIDLMQGRSSAIGPNRYPGDRDFHAPDRVTVQIHRLKIVRKDATGSIIETVVENTPALAIRLPPLIAARVTNVIVQPDH